MLGKIYARLAENGEIFAQVNDFDASAEILFRTLNNLSQKPFCESTRKFFSKVKVDLVHITKHEDAPKLLPKVETLSFSEEDRKVLEELSKP